MKLSLRSTLALWYVLTIPALIIGLLFTTQQILVSNLRGFVDETLQKRSQVVAASVVSPFGTYQEDYGSLIQRVTEQALPEIPLLLRIADPDGTVLATFGDVPGTMVLALDRQLKATGAREGQFRTVRVKDEEALRTYTVGVRDPSTQQTIVLIQTGSDLSLIGAAEARLWRYALGAGIIGSVIVLGVGMLILRRGFRPLDRILGRVQEIETGDLQPGLPHEPRPPELQQLADRLNAMWQRLDMAFKGRETFYASVSHELRTPLTALQGQIDVLMLQRSLDPAARECLQRMDREVRRLGRLTNNLLLGAQLEFDAALVAEDVSLRELGEEIVGEMWVLADGLELGLRIDEDIRVSADRDLLKQMVLNLVDNAIKFTRGGGHVELTVRKEANEAVLEVADSGIGIPPGDLARLLEGFKGDRGLSRQPGGGAGLGLAIAKRVADIHGGRIDIRSQEGTGTTVKVSLPILPEKPDNTPGAENQGAMGMG